MMENCFCVVAAPLAPRMLRAAVCVVAVSRATKPDDDGVFYEVDLNREELCWVTLNPGHEK